MDDESKWVELSRGGSAEAFGRLVLLHQGRIRAYIGQYFRNPDVVDDLAQEAFLSAYRSFSTFKEGFPLVPWLLGIARNRVLESLRADARRMSHESQSWELMLARLRFEEVDSQPPDLSDQKRQVQALERCLKGLPENSQSLVSEHYFRLRSMAEIARDAGKNTGSVRMALLRIRQALRHCVQQRLAATGVES